MADISGVTLSFGSSPTVHYTITYTVSESGNNAVFNFAITAQLGGGTSASFLGLQKGLMGYFTVGGATNSFQIKDPLEQRWYGNERRNFSCSVTCPLPTSSTTMSCTFRTTNGGSDTNVAGIGSSSAYTVTAPRLALTANGTPGSISATPNLFEESVTVSWGAATAGTGNSISAYQLDYSTNGGSSWTMLSNSIGSGTLQYVHMPALTVVPRGGKIRYRVRALSSHGSDYYSGYRTMGSDVTKNSAPAAPVLTIDKSNFTPGESVKVSWTGATDADNNISYADIYMRQQEEGTYQAWMLIQRITSVTAAGNYTFANCQFGRSKQSIQFRMIATDAFNVQSGYSNTVETVRNEVIDIPRICAGLNGSWVPARGKLANSEIWRSITPKAGSNNTWK